MQYAPMDPTANKRLHSATGLIPSPLMMGVDGRMIERYQRLITLYYIKSGASAVIPGAHTGQFARNDLSLYKDWLQLVKEMTGRFDNDGRMFLMAAAGGNNEHAMKMAEAAKANGYHLLMVAPTAFEKPDGEQLPEEGAIKLMQEIAGIIPVYGFYLQKAVGGRELSSGFWSELFDFSYGAKIAPFKVAETDKVMNAAVRHGRRDELVMSTGNDDGIVRDLSSIWHHPENVATYKKIQAGLLGHYATDTYSNIRLAEDVKWVRDGGSLTKEPFISHSMGGIGSVVSNMNFALFDADDLPRKPPYQNSVFGVHYRLAKLLGLDAKMMAIRWVGPDGKTTRVESGRAGLELEIDNQYQIGMELGLTDEEFIRQNLEQWKAMIDFKHI
ncbi:hypothetical protein HYV84_06350 [Candidatus Woesearchaeota archaeon]|nr:hypothetical protein [Candidatus Woesearchaeota archaeon]